MMALEGAATTPHGDDGTGTLITRVSTNVLRMENFLIPRASRIPEIIATVEFERVVEEYTWSRGDLSYREPVEDCTA